MSYVKAESYAFNFDDAFKIQIFVHFFFFDLFLVFLSF